MVLRKKKNENEDRWMHPIQQVKMPRQKKEQGWRRILHVCSCWIWEDLTDTVTLILFTANVILDFQNQPMSFPCVSHPLITSASLKYIFPSSNIIQSFITGILVDGPINIYYNLGNTKLQLQFNANINRLGKLFTSMFMLISECEMLACQSYHLF